MRAPILALALAAALSAPAAAQTTRFYDAAGHYMGKTEQRGSTQRHIGRNGENLGRSTITRTGRDRATVRDRDAAGHDIGRRELRR